MHPRRPRRLRDLLLSFGLLDAVQGTDGWGLIDVIPACIAFLIIVQACALPYLFILSSTKSGTRVQLGIYLRLRNAG